MPAKFKTPRAPAGKTAVISRYFNLSHNYCGPLREHCNHCASIAVIARALQPSREHCSHCASIAAIARVFQPLRPIARVFQPLRWHYDLLRNNCASSVHAIAGVLTPSVALVLSVYCVVAGPTGHYALSECKSCVRFCPFSPPLAVGAALWSRAKSLYPAFRRRLWGPVRFAS